MRQQDVSFDEWGFPLASRHRLEKDRRRDSLERRAKFDHGPRDDWESDNWQSYDDYDDEYSDYDEDEFDSYSLLAQWRR